MPVTGSHACLLRQQWTQAGHRLSALHHGSFPLKSQLDVAQAVPDNLGRMCHRGTIYDKLSKRKSKKKYVIICYLAPTAVVLRFNKYSFEFLCFLGDQATIYLKTLGLIYFKTLSNPIYR